jgi:hypothetical protein
MKTGRSLGFQILGVWLLLTGLHLLWPGTIPLLSVLQALLAIVAGLLILVGR